MKRKLGAIWRILWSDKTIVITHREPDFWRVDCLCGNKDVARFCPTIAAILEDTDNAVISANEIISHRK